MKVAKLVVIIFLAILLIGTITYFICKVSSSPSGEKFCNSIEVYSDPDNSSTQLENEMGGNLGLLMKLVRLENPYEEGSTLHAMWLEQSQYNIPALILASLEIPSTNVAFVHRDCVHLQPIHEAIHRTVNSSFHCSRIALKEGGEEWLDYVQKTARGKTIVDIHGSGKSIRTYWHDTFQEEPDLIYVTGNITNGRLLVYTNRDDSVYDAIERFNSSPLGSLAKFPKRKKNEFDPQVVECQQRAVNCAIRHMPFSFSPSLEKLHRLVSLMGNSVTVKTNTHLGSHDIGEEGDDIYSSPQEFYNSTDNSRNMIFCFWTGNNQMSDNRKSCLEQLKEVSECKVILVTPKNLDDYILQDHPLHEAYQYLSETHKADYLRTYFMHFHGGGYSDIKKTTGSWKPAFERLYQSNNYWICGYPEIKGGVAYAPYASYWRELIGNCAYICKPNTLLTREWYTEMMTLLDSKLEKLKLNPAKNPQDQKSATSNYPLEWNEMLGRIFHKIAYKYRSHLLRELPTSVFSDYR